MKPPTKKAGLPTGRRRFDGGEVLDVTGAAGVFGTKDKMIRARVARGEIPYRRWQGRIIFIRSELLVFLSKLEGVTADEALSNIAQRGGA